MIALALFGLFLTDEEYQAVVDELRRDALLRVETAPSASVRWWPRLLHARGVRP